MAGPAQVVLHCSCSDCSAKIRRIFLCGHFPEEDAAAGHMHLPEQLVAARRLYRPCDKELWHGIAPQTGEGRQEFHEFCEEIGAVDGAEDIYRGLGMGWPSVARRSRLARRSSPTTRAWRGRPLLWGGPI